jgi:hypothetical protein
MGLVGGFLATHIATVNGVPDDEAAALTIV